MFSIAKVRAVNLKYKWENWNLVGINVLIYTTLVTPFQRNLYEVYCHSIVGMAVVIIGSVSPLR